MTWLFAFFLWTFSLLFYVLPSIVASKRRHRNFTAILVLNLLAGWTLIGWIVSIVWACTDNVNPRPLYDRFGRPEWKRNQS
jgi:hypothetical protein